MTKIKIIILAIIISLLAGVFYFYYSGGLRLLVKLPQTEQQIEKAIVKTPLKEISRKVSAPAPLQAVEKVTEVVLTNSGVINLTNAERIKKGFVPLKENDKLDVAALIKANDMLENQYFSHISPTGKGAAELVKSVNYDYILVGENLALGIFKGDEGLVEGWMESVGHRANILNSRYTEIGVAVRKGIYKGESVWMAVQEFGLPLSACPKPDSALVSKIDSYEAQLEQLKSEILDKRQEFENIRPRSYEELSQLNQKIEDYNSLVNQYNNLAKEFKMLTSQYNNAVEVFNECIAG